MPIPPPPMPVPPHPGSFQGLQSDLLALAADVSADRSVTQRLERRMAELESRIEQLDRHAGRGPNYVQGYDQDLTSASKPTDAAKANDIADDMLDYAVGETLWDAPIIMGLPGIGGSFASCILAVGAMLNVVVQLFIVFTMLLSSSFIRDTLWHERVQAAERWRIFEGHNYEQVDAQGTSLVGRVCNGDGALSLAAEQKGMLNEINFYLSLNAAEIDERPLFSATGPSLCCVCLFLFVVIIFKDLRHTASAMHAVLSIAGGVRTRIENDEIVTMSVCRRFCAFLTYVCRALVALTLLFTGMQWLSTTSSTTDLILNVASLNFIMDIDEMLFQTVVPTVVQRFVGTLKPLKYRRPRLHVEAWLPLCLAFVSVTYGAVALVSPSALKMGEVKRAMCKEPTNFAVADTRAGYAVATKTDFFANASAADNYGIRGKAVQELVACGPDCDYKLIQHSFLAVDNEMFDEALHMSLDVMAKAGACEDIDYQSGPINRQERSFLLASVSTRANVYAGKEFDALSWHCADFVEHCNSLSLLRLICPVTCGCDSPISGQTMKNAVTGCPTACVEKSKRYLLDMPCEDRDVGGTSNWTRWWDGYRLAMYRLTPMLMHDGDYKSFLESTKQGSCTTLGVDPALGHDFCNVSSTFHVLMGVESIVGFCPRTCCKNGPLAGVACPLACTQARV